MIDLIARWDLDKTYLRSDFYTLRDLWRNAIERPDQKRPVPGAARLLRELSRSTTRIHVLSGSPRQMRKSIGKRLLLDGVRVDELTLKPNLQNLMRLRLAALKDQLGYKLTSLLEVRARERRVLKTNNVPEVLFGDDSEADAFVYSLYADVCAGDVSVDELEAILAAGHAYPDLRRRALEAARELSHCPSAAPVSILIHLDRQSPPSRFASFGRRLVPFFNYAQAAFILLDRGMLSARAAFGVGENLVQQHRFDLEALIRSYWDLRRRGQIESGFVDRLREFTPPERSELFDLAAGLEREVDIEAYDDYVDARAGVDGGPPLPASEPPPLDYIALATEHHGGRNRQ